jgi:hypothetical protein
MTTAHIRATILELARDRRAFTVNDVWDKLGALPTNANALVTSALTTALRDGIIRQSLAAIYTQGRTAHRRYVTIWLSTQQRGTPEDAAAYVVAFSNESGLSALPEHPRHSNAYNHGA